MKFKPMIESLLTQDLYKYSMGQAIYHQFPSYKTTWTFKCRNTDVKFTPEMVEEIKAQIQAYCQLQYEEDELAYLNNIPWLKGTGKISHGSPYTDEIAGFVSFDQISDLVKMGIGFLPKPLNEAFPIPGKKYTSAPTRITGSPSGPGRSCAIWSFAPSILCRTVSSERFRRFKKDSMGVL